MLLLLVLIVGVAAHHSLPVADAEHGAHHGTAPSGIDIALAAASCVGLVVALLAARPVRRLLRRLAALVRDSASSAADPSAAARPGRAELG